MPAHVRLTFPRNATRVFSGLKLWAHHVKPEWQDGSTSPSLSIFFLATRHVEAAAVYRRTTILILHDIHHLLLENVDLSTLTDSVTPGIFFRGKSSLWGLFPAVDVNNRFWEKDLEFPTRLHWFQHLFFYFYEEWKTKNVWNHETSYLQGFHLGE